MKLGREMLIAWRWPSARLSFCRHPLFIPVEPPTEGRGGVQQNASLADGHLVELLRPAIERAEPMTAEPR